MKKRAFGWGPLAAAFLLAAPAARAAEPLSWEACVEQTARANPELTAARSSLQSSEYQVRGAYGAFLPQLSAGLNLAHGNSSVSGVPVAADASNNYTATVTATQNLFSGFQDRARVDQARAGHGVSLASLDGVRAKVSSDLKTSFIGLIYSQNLIKLTEDIARRREANLKLVTLRFENGRENKGSQLLSKAYLAQARYEHVQAVNAVDIARAQLARVLGREDADELEISGTVPPGAAPEAPDLKALVLATPEYRSSISQEESADAAVTLARSSFFPVLSLTGTNNDTGTQWYPSSRHWSVAAGVTFSFFNGGRDYYSSRGAAEARNAATFTRENTLRVELTRLRQTRAAFLEAVQKLEVDRTFAEAADTRARIAREKYNNGLLSFEDWDIIENDLINREKARLQSERDRINAEAAWEQAQGKGVIP